MSSVNKNKKMKKLYIVYAGVILAVTSCGYSLYVE